MDILLYVRLCRKNLTSPPTATHHCCCCHLPLTIVLTLALPHPLTLPEEVSREASKARWPGVAGGRVRKRCSANYQFTYTCSVRHLPRMTLHSERHLPIRQPRHSSCACKKAHLCNNWPSDVDDMDVTRVRRRVGKGASSATGTERELK